MKELPAYARFTLMGTSIALIILAMVTARELLLPFSWALLLALLILPLQRKLERHIPNKLIATLLSILTLVLIIGGVLFLLSSQVVTLVNDLPDIAGKVSGHLNNLRQYIDEKLGIPYHEQTFEFTDQFSSLFKESLGSLGIALTNTAKTLVYIGILPIYIFFMLYYRYRITVFFSMLYKPNRRQAVTGTLWKAGHVVQKYLSGMVIVTFIVAVLVFILFLVLGVKHALFFAIFMAVFNLIPYVGVFIASTVSILFVLVTKDSMLYALLTLFSLWGIQIVENNLITPFIVGRQVKLNPLAVILVIILGGMIWGVSGMVLFIPLLGGIKVILDDIPSLRPYGYLLGDDPPKEGSLKTE